MPNYFSASTARGPMLPGKPPRAFGGTTSSGQFGAPGGTASSVPPPNAFKGGQMTGAPGGTKPMFGAPGSGPGWAQDPTGRWFTDTPPTTVSGGGGPGRPVGGRRDPNMFGGFSREQLLADPRLLATLGQHARSRWGAGLQPTSGGGLQAPNKPLWQILRDAGATPTGTHAGNAAAVAGLIPGGGTSTEDTITPQPGNGMTVSTLPMPMPGPSQRSPTTGGIAQMPTLPPVLPQVPPAFKGFGFENLNAPSGVDAQGLPIYAQRAPGVQTAWDMAGGANRGQLRIDPITGQQQIFMGSGQGGDTYSWQGYDPNNLGQRQNAELFQRYGPNWTSGSGATSMHGSDIAGILTEHLGRQPTQQEVYDQYYGVAPPIAGIPRNSRNLGGSASGVPMPGAFGG